VFDQLRKDCNEEDFLLLANSVELTKVPKYERIFNYGDFSDRLYLVVRGQIGIIYPTKDLKDLIDHSSGYKEI
jgi:CRP-like cAMP-binding protein